MAKGTIKASTLKEKNWKVTIRNENLNKISVWTTAKSNDEAKEKAFATDPIKTFLDGYNGLYTVSVLTEEQVTKFQIFQKDNRSRKEESRIKVKKQ